VSNPISEDLHQEVAEAVHPELKPAPVPPAKRPTYTKFKAQFKNHQIHELKKECERLQAENEQLKTDPEGVIGKFLGDYNKVAIQNNRLSAALCATMKENGNLVVKKETIDSFVKHRLIINFDTDEEAGTFTFSYVAEPVEPKE
jgi:hypothetical protein